MHQYKHLIPALAAILAVAVLSGCQSSTGQSPKLPEIGDLTSAVTDLFRSDPRSESDPTAEALYQDGVDYFERGRYARSISFFQKLRDDFPFSKEAEDAELKIAEAYYLNEEYVDAAETYKNYLTFQPTGRHTHFVKYQLGRVNLDQFTGVDRDLEKVKTAKRYFESVIADHPESEHVADARKRLAETRIHLAERELYVGNFYLKEERYLPARKRFENILRNYPDTPAAPKARAELARLPDVARSSAEGLPTSKTSTETTPKPAREKAEAVAEPARFITKEGYVDEDPDRKPWYGYLNPFSWGDEEEPEDRKVAARRADPAEDKTAAKETSVAEKVTSFFDRLNPFSSTEEGKTGEPKQPAPAETASVKAVVEEIDKTLRAPGPSTDAPTPPVSNLPPEEKPAGPPPTDPAKVLGEIDSKLGRATQPGDAPTPPASDPALFSVRKAQDPSGKSDPAGARPELLEGIDKQLEKEGVAKPGDLPRPPASRP